MVRKIRLRGHVIRLYEVPAGTSQSKAKSCPSCDNVYDNGVYRKCIYLCCEFESCFHCVLNKNKSWCPIIKTRLPKERMGVTNVKQECDSDDELDTSMTTQSKSSNVAAKLPSFCSKNQAVDLKDSKGNLDIESSPMRKEESVELPKTSNEKISEELSKAVLPVLCSGGQIEVPVNLERNLELEVNQIPSDEIVELSAFLNAISEDYFCNNNECNDKPNSYKSISADLTGSIQQHRSVVSKWLPEILLDKVSVSPNLSVNHDKPGISRLRNGKIFATNQ